MKIFLTTKKYQRKCIEKFKISMEVGHNLLLLLFLSISSVNCYPSKPLNDRPSELTWQAWLLVDSQNQLQNESDRRITPKSVFIAPKLDQKNQSLPDCAEGYKADAMGRCIKFVKVDETAHLNFLLQRLNEMYAGDEEFEETEEEDYGPTPGPLQVNIPLGQAEDVDNKDSIPFELPEEIGNPDVVVIAPTNGNFDEKPNVKRHPPSDLNTAKTEQVELPPISYVEEDSDEKIETTTLEETTTDSTEDTTTQETTETTQETEFTTLLSNVADDGLKALFFLMPPNNTTLKQNNTTINTTTPRNLEKYEKENYPSTETQLVETLSTLIGPKNNFKFPEDELKFTHEPNQEQRTDFIVDRGYYNQRHSTELTASQIKELFRRYIQRPENLDREQITHERIFNHRNRDRNYGMWNERPENEKLSVVQFERYPSTNYPQNIYTKHITPEIRYYGEGTSQEYSNIYGRKRRRGNFR